MRNTNLSSYHLNLKATFKADGTTDVRGAVQPPGEGPNIAIEIARSQCAGADGDRTGGLTELTAEFRDNRIRETVEIVLQTLPGQAIDERGVYPITIHIDEDPATTVEVRARVSQDRPTRKR